MTKRKKLLFGWLSNFEGVFIKAVENGNKEMFILKYSSLTSRETKTQPVVIGRTATKHSNELGFFKVAVFKQHR